jgi:hypothetical protein
MTYSVYCVAGWATITEVLRILGLGRNDGITPLQPALLRSTADFFWSGLGMLRALKSHEGIPRRYESPARSG